MVSAAGLAFAAGACACIAVADLARALVRGAWAQRAARARGLPLLAGVLEALATAGNEGRDPERAERIRALAAVALVAVAGGWVFAGLAGALLAGICGPVAAGRMLRVRRDRYRRAVEAAAGSIARTIADALAGGHSLRGAIAVAARGLHGPPGSELARVAAELDLGAPTEAALDAMRHRIGASAIDVIVAGALLQRQAGGDLVRMLRNAALALEDEQRLLGDVRAATAQARFTGIVVVLLPLGGALLAELASPGFAARSMASSLSAWMIGLAVAMQAGAAFAIRRLARARV